MSDFFEKAKETAKKAGNFAADKAGDAAEIGKYKAKIMSQKNEISNSEKELGKIVYRDYVDGNAQSEEMINLCQKITEAKKIIEDYEAEIEKVKDHGDSEHL